MGSRQRCWQTSCSAQGGPTKRTASSNASEALFEAIRLLFRLITADLDAKRSKLSSSGLELKEDATGEAGSL